MLIAQVEPPHATRGGDWYYRTLAPGRAMSKHPGIHVVDLTNVHRARERILREADVVVLNMVCDPDLLPLVAERKALGRPTVYEINDDVSSLQPWNPAAGFFDNPEHQNLFRRHANQADAIQFSTPELARIYGYLNPRGRIFRNQLTQISERPRKPHQGVVIGWGGSHGHLDDMRRIAPRLIGWVKEHPAVTFHVMGSEPIAKLFDDLPAAQRRHFGTGSLDAYYAFVDTLDIGIAPLADTGFNRCRSDVKFLEYASRGVVPVMQSLAPYADTIRSGATGFLFDDVEGMLAILDDLVSHPDRIAEVGAAAHAYVASERREEAHGIERIELYRELARGNKKGPSDDERAALRAFAETIEGATADEERHWSLDPTRYEALLHDALVIGQMMGRRADAAALLREAAALAPESYQPHLFAIDFASDPAEELELALTKNPKSVLGWLKMGTMFERAGNAQKALQMFLRAAEICPGYEIPYVRTAALLKAQGNAEQAAHFARLADDLARPLQPPTRRSGPPPLQRG